MSVKITIQTTRKAVKLKKKFDVNSHTLFDVKKEYCDNHDNKRTPSKMRLKKSSKPLSQVDNHTLFSLGIKGPFQMLLLVSGVSGGALALSEVSNSNVLSDDYKRNRKLDKSDTDIKITKKPDCCVYYDDKDGMERAEMPCGHAFVPQTMFDLVKAVITKNDYEFDIICPICKKEFDFDLCAKVADMNEDEYFFFAGEIAKRSLAETKECPFCNADCERPESLKEFRVNCSSCSGGDWCFLCAGKWKGGGFIVCGNKGCPSADINDILQNCDEKKTPYKENNKDIMVPEIRACPNCLDFIEHDDSCKHMTCKACGHEFCFACLKPKLNGNWQCGTHRNQCVIAPRQVLK